MSEECKASWEDFAAFVAQLAHVPAEAIGKDTWLVEDLGLDSLRLSEVVVMLIMDLEMNQLADDFQLRSWKKVRVGDLYEEYRFGRRPPSQEDHTIRLGR